jgi:type II secretory pathway component PulF
MIIHYQQVYEQIATMLNAGLDLKKALHTAADVSNRELHDAIIAVGRSIERGDTLARALARQQKIFPLPDRTLIDAGEKSGRLPEVFEALADWYRFKDRLLMIMKSGLMRPFITLTAAAFIMPAPTIFSDSMGAYISSVLLLLVVFYIPPTLIFVLYRKSDKQGSFRLFIDKLFLKIPLAGSALRNMALGRYCFGFWMLFESGVAIDKCAQIATELCGNSVISAMVTGGGRSAQQGSPVSKGFSSELPDDFLAIWKVGEESGRLGETLRRLYEKQIEKAEYYFKELSSWGVRLVSALVGLVIIYYILKNASVFVPKI